MGKKIRAGAVCAINLIGLACLMHFGYLYVSHNTEIANPDAMLVMEGWERGGLALLIGVIPLFIANLLAFLFVGNKHRKILNMAFFTPAVVCVVLAVHYLIFSLS